MASPKSQSYASIQIDTAGLKDLAKVLRQAQPELKKQLYKGLRVSADLVKEEAKFKAQWSSRIPGSLKVGGSGLNLKVIAQSAIAPDSAPLEHGGQGGMFRHPVFEVSTAKGGGGRTLVSHSKKNPQYVTPAGLSRLGGVAPWVYQAARPFLAPAVDARIDQIVEIVENAVDEALIAAGFDR